MPLRAKFVITDIEETMPASDARITLKVFKAAPVYPDDVNKKLWQSKAGGFIELRDVDKEALSEFKVGHVCYMDLSLAPSTEEPPA